MFDEAEVFGEDFDSNKYDYLKDLLHVCMMSEVEYFCICIKDDNGGNDEYNQVCDFFKTVYSTNRLVLPFKGVVVIGY